VYRTTGQSFLILTCGKSRPFYLEQLVGQKGIAIARWALSLLRVPRSNSLFKHPDVINALPMSGVYDLRISIDGCTTTVSISTIPSITSRMPATPWF